MGELWKELGFSERQDLFREMVRDACPAERVQLLFGLLKNLLNAMAQSHQETRRREAGVYHALSTISFLRESLVARPDDPFHGAFKRFYNNLHRQIIDAVRDLDFQALAGPARSIGTLISDANADAFVGHCIGQSAWREHRLVFILERLHAAVPGTTPVLAEA